MNLGLYLPPFGPFAESDALVEVARRAEAAGWDGVFLWDHLVADDFLVADPWVCLGAMAAVTERVVLGPLVTPLARRRPWVVAQQAATLARISAGRAVLGVGVGWPGPDFDAFGEPGGRAAMLDEALDVVRAVWAGGPVDHTGRHYRVSLDASPPASPHVPIWGAHILGRDASLRRAAGLDGVMPIEDEDAARMGAEDVERLVRRLRDLGARDDFDVVVRGGASRAWPEPPSTDVAALEQAGMTWWLESMIHFDPLELTLEVIDAGPTALR